MKWTIYEMVFYLFWIRSLFTREGMCYMRCWFAKFIYSICMRVVLSYATKFLRCSVILPNTSLRIFFFGLLRYRTECMLCNPSGLFALILKLLHEFSLRSLKTLRRAERKKLFSLLSGKKPFSEFPLLFSKLFFYSSFCAFSIYVFTKFLSIFTSLRFE